MKYYVTAIGKMVISQIQLLTDVLKIPPLSQGKKMNKPMLGKQKCQLDFTCVLNEWVFIVE